MKIFVRNPDGRRPRSATLLAGLMLIGSVAVAGVGRVSEQPAHAAPIDEKHTICHRTHATTNPYRRITVSANAIFNGGSGTLKNSGHPGNHDEYPFDNWDTANPKGTLSAAELTAEGISVLAAGDADSDGVLNSVDTTFYGVGTYTKDGSDNITEIVVKFSPNVFNPSWFGTNSLPANQKKWGDIIPPLSGGTDVNGHVNYVGNGITLFNSSCETMTAKQFYDREIAAGRTPKEALQDLDDQGANEDRKLKDSLPAPKTFASLCVDGDNNGVCDSPPDLTLLEKVNAQTQNSSDSDADDSPEMNGTCTVAGETIRVEFRYAPTGLLGTPSEVVVDLGSVTIPGAPNDTQSFTHEIPLSLLLRPQVYQYRIVCITDPTDPALIGELDGGIKTFSTPPLPIVIPPTTSSPSTSTTIPETLDDPPATPSKDPQDPRGHQNNGPNDITPKVKVDPQPNPNGPGGTLTIEPNDDLPPVEATGCTVDDSDYECIVKKSGPEYNNPQTWQDMGFGDECWKIEPGGYSYTLPDPPQPPSGRTGGTYSLVLVKAGSIRSTDPDFQVRTPFWSPSGGTAVWPDSNKDGIYNPGGQNGDKEISHVIFCVNYGGSVTPPAPGATTTAAPGATTTAAPGATTTAAPGDSTTLPPSIRPLEIEIRKKTDENPDSTDPDEEDSDKEIAVCIELTVGVDEEELCGELDLDNFEWKNAFGEESEPELPVTGSSSNDLTNVALMSMVFGALVWTARRRLLADKPRP